MKSCIFKISIFAISILIISFFCMCSGGKTRSVTYEYTVIRLSTLERTVTSSGTINPVAIVKVLPRMSGRVEKVFVNNNDTVKAGDILAELNTDVIRLKRDQQLSTVRKARANYELQLMNFRSQESLLERNLISEFEFRSGRTALENMTADLEAAEANLRVIETEINQYAYITSPIDGIVLGRHINAGDTVVDSSSNNSAAIFTLAENLREMQIQAAVGELDVVSIQRGQAVRFTLESLPGRRFTGTVENINMMPVVSNNVVTYTVIIAVENHDGILFPGMTCAVNFVVQQSENTLVVANAALRYQPSVLSAEKIEEMEFMASLANMDIDQQNAAIEEREQTLSAQNSGKKASTGLVGLLTGAQSRPAPRPASGGGTRAAVVFRNIWYMNNDGSLEVIQVQTGISTSTLTEIISPEDLEGKQVILREKLLN
ncbi:MAG: efflux RND transporter periplasmic adaptor subunit [Treponema sp.]|nr:efflux RND transporter periplasmic adaptor subunit [Treponema sp.]MCL2272046.1 efflux RND transporter periplasmic adaptor subunit [Treponema sp.]MCL2272813.1 efflux RND transporter periplasmic adaptor subunit [Treponema sp.]